MINRGDRHTPHREANKQAARKNVNKHKHSLNRTRNSEHYLTKFRHFHLKQIRGKMKQLGKNERAST